MDSSIVYNLPLCHWAVHLLPQQLFTFLYCRGVSLGIFPISAFSYLSSLAYLSQSFVRLPFLSGRNISSRRKRTLSRCSKSVRDWKDLEEKDVPYLNCLILDTFSQNPDIFRNILQFFPLSSAPFVYLRCSLLLIYSLYAIKKSFHLSCLVVLREAKGKQQECPFKTDLGTK